MGIVSLGCYSGLGCYLEGELRVVVMDVREGKE